MTDRPTPPLASFARLREAATSQAILDGFLDYVTASGIELYPAQEEALLEIVADRNVVLNTPTGSGKSLVAAAMHYKAMCEGRRSVYTSPIKALASEKFFALCDLFGADHVGMLTGDASINRDAPILCCTAEVLANMALRAGEDLDIDYVIIDEFHYFADRERGVAWEIPLLTLKHATFLLMSATMGETAVFEQKLTALNGRPTVLVQSQLRPVPLDFEYRETPLHETLEDLIAHGRAPIYLVNFTQRSCAEEAQNLMSTNFSTREEKQKIYEALKGARFDSPYGKEIQKFLRHGIGIHHAGLLPKYRLLVEKLAQQGLLKTICGTDTLGVGVNVPIRTVLFTKLCKYDGEKTIILSVRDFKQICGRAGRKGYDDHGSVVAQAPEHVIENLKLEAKAAGDPVKLRKLVRRKPPEKGYVPWDRSTFERLQARPPENLVSRFAVSHGMLVSVLQGAAESGANGYRRLLDLIAASFLDAHNQRAQKRRACDIFRALRGAGIIEVVSREHRKGARVQLAAHLQDDFSLHQTLSLYLLDVLEKVDPEMPEYALTVLSLVEAIVEDPDVVLMRQLDVLKTRKMDELKAEGVEFEKRIEELDKMEYPKPNREFVYATFNDFAKKHPWLGQTNIRPKSVAREMFEAFMSFDEYIREYALQRSEGLLLRYLSDVYKAFVQSVPERYVTPELLDVEEFLRGTVRGVDSSLLDAWEALQSPGAAVPRAPSALAQRIDAARDAKVAAARVRAEVLRLVQALGAKDWERAAEMLVDGDPLTVEAAMAPYFAEYERLVLDQEARSAKYAKLEASEGQRWHVTQTLMDPEHDGLWVLEVEADLARASVREAPWLTWVRIGTS